MYLSLDFGSGCDGSLFGCFVGHVFWEQGSYEVTVGRLHELDQVVIKDVAIPLAESVHIVIDHSYECGTVGLTLSTETVTGN